MAPHPPKSTLDFEVAILGGGIAGCIVACGLSDLGYEVAVIDQHAQMMDGASRWNDGKIHLGYTFTGTPSLTTAELMQQGASVFVPILERVTGRRVDPIWFGSPTIYVVDETSMIDLETLWRRAQAVGRSLVVAAQALPGLSKYVPPSGVVLERLDPDQALSETGQRRAVGGWRTTERAVSTREIAAVLRSAVAERAIPTIQAQIVKAERGAVNWRVRFADGRSLNSLAVVNCLWEGRALLDRSIIPPAPTDPPVSIRYKRCLFGSNTGLESVSSSTRILGRFGDIATYGNGDACLSWYPAALAARSETGVPPDVGVVDEDALATATLAGLGLAPNLLHNGAWEVKGGYVVAPGSGDIDEPRSLLHMRDRAGVRELSPGFVSVDTGKYTLGPMLALHAIRLIAGRLGHDGQADLLLRIASA